MQNDAILQVRIDSEIKSKAEEIFEQLGITFADAVRIFAVQAINSDGFPFEITLKSSKPKVLKAAGIASKYADISKISMEKNAWTQAMKEKYADY